MKSDESISYEDYLDRYDSLTYTNVGVSMLPLLRQGKDLFVVHRKGADRCKRGDVVLFRRPPSSYVLHRVIEVRPDDYVTMGDNTIGRERGIRDDDILGVMTGFVRNGRHHDVSEPGYRLYTFFVLHTIGPRVFCKRAKGRLKRLIKARPGKNQASA